MITDTVLRSTGMNILIERLGMVDAERFVALVSREPFDYTVWQDDLFDGMSVEELSAAAMDFSRRRFPEG